MRTDGIRAELAHTGIRMRPSCTKPAGNLARSAAADSIIANYANRQAMPRRTPRHPLDQFGQQPIVQSASNDGFG